MFLQCLFVWLDKKIKTDSQKMVKNKFSAASRIYFHSFSLFLPLPTLKALPFLLCLCAIWLWKRFFDQLLFSGKKYWRVVKGREKTTKQRPSYHFYYLLVHCIFKKNFPWLSLSSEITESYQRSVDRKFRVNSFVYASASLVLLVLVTMLLLEVNFMLVSVLG